MAVLLHKDEKALQKADVGGSDHVPADQGRPEPAPVSHLSRLRGPQDRRGAAPLRRRGAGRYRKNQWIPFAPFIGPVLITPTLGFTYQVTEWVARLFGGPRGTTASRSSC